MRKLLVAFLVAPLGLAQPPETSLASPPQMTANLESHLLFQIHAERLTILQSEPLQLTLRLTNVSTEAVTGFLSLSPVLPRTRVRYRRLGDPDIATFVLGQEGRGFDPIVRLAPNESSDSETVWMAFDAALRRSPFAEAGDYEVEAHFTPDLANEGATLRSNVLRVSVTRASGHLAEALAAYDVDLAEAAQPELTPWLSDPALRKALTFVRRFPGSPYARLVRSKAAQALKVRMGQGELTPQAKAEYARELAALNQPTE